MPLWGRQKSPCFNRNPLFPGHADALENIRTSAAKRGIEVFSRELNGLEDLESAFEDAVRAKARAAVFMADNVMFGNRKQDSQNSRSNTTFLRIHSFPPEVRDGGLMFYGPGRAENCPRGAALFNRIFEGARARSAAAECRRSSFQAALGSAPRCARRRLARFQASVTGADRARFVAQLTRSRHAMTAPWKGDLLTAATRQIIGRLPPLQSRWTRLDEPRSHCVLF